MDSLGPPFQVKKKIEEAFTKAEKKEIYDKALEAGKLDSFLIQIPVQPILEFVSRLWDILSRRTKSLLEEVERLWFLLQSRKRSWRNLSPRDSP